MMMQPFVRFIEVWVPSADRTHLELSEGLYGQYDGFAESSKRATFAYGEGLPGRAWAECAPIILQSIGDPYFKRMDAARAAGISGGVACPIFSGDFLMAVLVFLFGGDEHKQAGAVEIWEPDSIGQLGLKDGFYGTLDEFAWISRRIRFQKGKGLPGRAWEARLPVIMSDLGNSDSFLRAQDARKAGLTTGLALPCFCPAGKEFVVTFLSGDMQPIARRFEIWTPTSDGTRLGFHDGCALEGAMLKAAYQKATFLKGEGALGRAWKLGIPVVLNVVLSDPVLESGALVKETSSRMLAIPILDDGALSCAVAFYL